MEQPVVNVLEYSKESFYQTGTIRLIAVSIVHLAVSLGVIGISTFIPAQLAIIGWNTTLIAFLLGIATLFELFRLFSGYLGDHYSIFGSYRRNYVIIGFITQLLGLIVISQLLGSILILFGMILFTIGSATVATMADAYLVDITTSENRGKAAATIQFFRLSGFAIGGILGAILYGQLKFEGFFILLAIITFVLGTISILALKEKKKQSDGNEVFQFRNSNISEVWSIVKNITNPAVVFMSLFLVLFLIGVFTQDAILEPYAVKIFNFSEGNIGRLAAIWGTTTLIFIPLAILLERKIGRLWLSLAGTIIGAAGLLIITFLGMSPIAITNNLAYYQNLFLIGVAIFGVGVGLVTTPSTAMMLDVCSSSESRTLLLAFFGLISTVGRSGASFIAGIILLSSSYQFLFIFETIVLLCSFPALIWAHKHLLKIIISE
ncbi:MAG: MFS transporter [Promethearchaeota archaeon]